MDVTTDSRTELDDATTDSSLEDVADRRQRLQLLMVLQLKNLMVPQLMMLMVPQLIMMFLPQNTAMLPDVDVPDLATLADLPQLGLTETETGQLPEDQQLEDQQLKLQELADSSDKKLLRPPEDKLVHNSNNQDVDVV